MFTTLDERGSMNEKRDGLTSARAGWWFCRTTGNVFDEVYILEGCRFYGSYYTVLVKWQHLWCSKWKVDDLPREERLYN